MAQNLSRMLGRIGALFGLLFVGLTAGLSVLALGTKAVVLVPALAGAFAMLIIPYSPLYSIVAAIPVNVEIAGPITVIRLVIVFGVFVAIVQGIKKQAPRLHIPWPEGALPLCMFVWMFFTTIAVSQGELVARLGGFFVYAVIFFMLLIYVDTLERFRNAVITLVVVGLFQVFLVVLEARFDLVIVGGLQAELAEQIGDEVRVVGASAHPIFLASFFQVVMTIAILLMVTAKTAFWRFAMFASFGLFIMGWISAWSRSTWIGMVVMIGVAMLLWTRFTRRLAIVGGALGFVVLATHDFSASAVMETVDQLALVQQGSFRAGVSHSSESFGWRTENWSAAVSIWASSPIFGVGIDRTDAFMYDNLPPGAVGHRFTNAALPHNMFLQVLAESGLPAFIMFVSLWISSFWALWRAWKVDVLRPYAYAMLVIMSGQVVTYFFNPIPREIWFSMAMSLVLGRFAWRYEMGER